MGLLGRCAWEAGPMIKVATTPALPPIYRHLPPKAYWMSHSVCVQPPTPPCDIQPLPAREYRYLPGDAGETAGAQPILLRLSRSLLGHPQTLLIVSVPFYARKRWFPTCSTCLHPGHLGRNQMHHLQLVFMRHMFLGLLGAAHGRIGRNGLPTGPMVPLAPNSYVQCRVLSCQKGISAAHCGDRPAISLALCRILRGIYDVCNTELRCTSEMSFGSRWNGYTIPRPEAWLI